MPLSAHSRRQLEQRRLDQLLPALELAVTGEAAIGPCLLAVAGPVGDADADLEFAVRPIVGDPYLALQLADFPPDAWAIGLVVSGWASHDDRARPSRAADRVRSRTVLLAGQSGARAALTVLGNGCRVDAFPTGAMAAAVVETADRVLHRLDPS